MSMECRWADETGAWTVRWDENGVPREVNVVGAHPEPGDAPVSYARSLPGHGVACSGPHHWECTWILACGLVRFVDGARGADCWPKVSLNSEVKS